MERFVYESYNLKETILSSKKESSLSFAANPRLFSENHLKWSGRTDGRRHEMKLSSRRIFELTKELVNIKSVVGTEEENRVSEKLYEVLSALPYYKEHPEDLFFVENLEDPQRRNSLMAVLKGQKEENSTAVVLIGHIDTVGISDYGALAPYATNPDLLPDKLKELDLPEAVQKDIESGEYLFGRGVLDMKSGVSMIAHLLEAASGSLSDFSGNLVACFVSDEEGNSRGMLSCVPKLVELKNKEKFHYTVAIDTDYTSTRTLHDNNRYLYAGTVGKLMPSFYIVGKETHVGDPFGGLDANELASELVRKINLNVALSDESMGEVTVPPVTLRLRDLKPEYSVQTNRDAEVYFNYATHGITPEKVLAQLKKEAEESFQSVITKLQAQYDVFTERMHLPKGTLPWKVLVLTYEELFLQVERTFKDLSGYMNAYAEKLLSQGITDEREVSMHMAKELTKISGRKEPLMLLYFSPPYYPHMAVTGETEVEKKLLSILEGFTDENGPHPVVFRKFYPYISDLSYFSLPEAEAVEALKKNMPGFSVSYKLPLEEIRNLSLPVANIGPYGFDAHQYTERIEKEYSFEKLPPIFLNTVLGLLEK